MNELYVVPLNYLQDIASQYSHMFILVLTTVTIDKCSS